jgi:hypothetical protein
MALPAGDLVTYSDIAAKIAPGKPPTWLTDLLREWAPGLMLDCAVHSVQPTKEQMRKRMRVVSAAASFLRMALQDTTTHEFLEVEGAIRIENTGDFDHTLAMIGERALTAANSKQLKRGRGKAVPHTAFGPKEYCAAIVSELWKFFRGKYPSVSSRRVI